MALPPTLILGNFLTQKPTGVQRYAIELTRVLAERNPEAVTLFHAPWVTVPPRLAHVRTQQGSIWPRFLKRVPGWAFFDAPLYLRLRERRGRLVWNPSNIGVPTTPRQLITLHDLSFYRHPEFFSASFRAKHKIACEVTLRQVLGVMTVSHTVKGEIEEKFPFLKGRVGVAYNGVSAAFTRPPESAQQPVIERHGLTKPYFLTVSSVDPRKNNKFLIRAFHASGLAAQGYELLLAGGKFATFSEDPEFEQLLASPGVRHLGYVDDADLPTLYARCRAFVFPSLYEGFGIPLIEAEACGARVLCSDIPVFREVAAPGARFFSPLKVESLVSALRDAVQATEPVPPARDFSWEKAAESVEAFLAARAVGGRA